MSAANAAPASSPAGAKDAFVVGVTISLVTITDEDIMGEIFAYDPLTTCLVLREIPKDGSGLPPGGKRGTIRVIKRSAIKSFQYERGSGSNPGPLPAVDIKKVQMREYQREHKARADQAKVNKNVAQDVQNIFNALTKTLPCEWGPDNSIVVLDSVTIKAPYTPDDCTGTETYTLERVKKVLHGERSRLSTAA